MTHGPILLLSADVPGLELVEPYSDQFPQDCAVIKWRSWQQVLIREKISDKLDSEKAFILQEQEHLKKCTSFMKLFLFRPTSWRVFINWDTLGLVIFLPITEAIWELFSQGDIFKPMLNSKEQKQRGLRHAGLSLSSVISAGALDKQDFPSLMRWVRVNTPWVKLIESSPSPSWWQRCFLTGNLHSDCLARTATNASEPAAETCRHRGAAHPPPALLAVQHHTLLQSLPPRRAQETQYLPARLHWVWLETKIYEI